VSSDVIIGHDGKPRCAWAGTGNTAAIRYHDEVWGTRTYDEPAMFEALTAGNSPAARSSATRTT
jgi:DNA-3-methyladenine glycosylase I